MRKFLCLENLVMKEIGRVELTAGRLYRETKPIGDRDNAVINNSGKTHNNVQRWGVFVETFERDGVEWIKHDGGGCPVPGGWKVEFSHEFGGHILGRGGLRASLFCWVPIVAYRIISTGEPAIASETQGIEEAARRAPESITAVDTSPAPKFEPTATHTIPAAAVADIDYNPMMLGGKFGGGIER